MYLSRGLRAARRAPARAVQKPDVPVPGSAPGAARHELPRRGARAPVHQLDVPVPGLRAARRAGSRARACPKNRIFLCLLSQSGGLARSRAFRKSGSEKMERCIFTNLKPRSTIFVIHHQLFSNKMSKSSFEPNWSSYYESREDMFPQGRILP